MRQDLSKGAKFKGDGGARLVSLLITRRPGSIINNQATDLALIKAMVINYGRACAKSGVSLLTMGARIS